MQNDRILSIAAILACLFPSTCNMALGQEPAAAGRGEGTGRPETVGFHQARYFDQALQNACVMIALPCSR